MVKEKIKGAVFGAVIGDALGTLVEEMDRETVKRAYGGAILGFMEPSPLSVCPYLKRGQYSHESQIFLLALEVYAEKGYFDENLYVEKLIEWVKDEKSHRYPSGAHVNAALSYAAGLESDEARVKACDVDGAIPAVAAGLFRWDNSLEAYQEGAYVSSITHSDETLVDSAGVLAAAVSMAVGGRAELSTLEGKLSFVDSLRELARSENVRGYLDLLVQVLKKGELPLDDVILLLGNGSFAPEATSLGIYLFLRYPSSYRRAVLSAVNSYGEFGGDTDAVAFITGALSGGYLSISAVPKEWIECLENSRQIEITVERFLEKIRV
ncbi:ADP-ribosylglycohydrolase family protein [Thermovibrio sp.]